MQENLDTPFRDVDPETALQLVRDGFSDVLNMTEGMSCWRGPRDHEPGQPFSATRPCSWLILNADLLKPKELPSLVAPLEVLRRREGEYEGRMVSAVAARRPRG